jgi:hypothetical protein
VRSVASIPASNDARRLVKVAFKRYGNVARRSPSRAGSLLLVPLAARRECGDDRQGPLFLIIAAFRAQGRLRQLSAINRHNQQARKLVAIWNTRACRGARPSFYPTLETVMLAGTPWLSYMCPACRTVGEVDVSTLDRHPAMSISGLIPSLSCRWCCDNPPFAKLLELTPHSTIAAALRKGRKR